MGNKMFCYQCQETAGNKGCTVQGVCGKTAELAGLQDLLVYTCKGLSAVGVKARKVGIIDSKVDNFIINSLFSTITNANFDENFFVEKINEAIRLRECLKQEVLAKGGNLNKLPEAAEWTCISREEMDTKAPLVGVLSTNNEDKRSLKELVTYGLKGLSAYLRHANQLGYSNENINEFIQVALAKTLDEKLIADELVDLALDTGKYGVDAMALLDRANTESYGHPEITKVNIGVRNNPAILVSGHDLKDIDELLKQTQGTGVDVYTHSEMLPAHYYPAFKKYDHFVGNYGNAWWMQITEFESFNGPILMTTNCLVPPKDSYKDRVYTTGIVRYEGLKYIEDGIDGHKDFSEIIEHAKKCLAPTEIETGEIIGGFAHNQVLKLADSVVEAVKIGAIKNFFVMAGCDGRSKSRDYYREFAKGLPKDSVILTAGCAKYKYNKLDLGDIGGIPRVLDAGQCNDSYSLVVIALKLAEVFQCGVNDLPIKYNIAWYEQKAVIVLLSLLYLGVKNIHLGPTLPAFLSEHVVNVLVRKFGIGGITDVQSDMAMFMF